MHQHNQNLTLIVQVTVRITYIRPLMIKLYDTVSSSEQDSYSTYLSGESGNYSCECNTDETSESEEISEE